MGRHDACRVARPAVESRRGATTWTLHRPSSLRQPDELEDLVRQGESGTLELKKTSAELETAARTLCGVLNGAGGRVLLGVTPGGRIIGQDVSDQTRQTIAAALRKFEPPAAVGVEECRLPNTQRSVIVLAVDKPEDGVPYTYDGRPYERIAATTSIMPQERYQRLLVERVHATRRWENTPAESMSIADLDHEEILRTARNRRTMRPRRTSRTGVYRAGGWRGRAMRYRLKRRSN